MIPSALPDASITVSEATQLVGIIGDPIGHTRSPRMHNAAFRALDIDWAYLAFHVKPDQLKSAVYGLADMGLKGFNVTIPHKETILPYLDSLTPAAEVIGAVNTVTIKNGKLTGHNTDGEGFSLALHEAHRFKAERSRALILGAGGSARAVCDQLAREGLKQLRICARKPEKAKELAAHIHAHHPRCEAKTLAWSPLDHRAGINWAELIVNTTPVGMKKGDGSPIDTNVLSPGHIVVDLIYAPPLTPLLSACEKLRARCLNGMGMLLHQGAAAFRLWTGKEPPVDIMRQTLTEPQPGAGSYNP